MEIMEMTEELFQEAQKAVKEMADQLGLKAPQEPTQEVKDLELRRIFG